MAYTNDDTTVQLFLNGTLVASGAQPTARYVNYLGFTNFNGDPPSDADFDEVKIFSRVLSLSQITSDINMTSPYIIIL
jgi:hypothetical protein